MRRPAARSEQGQSLVELALYLPFLLFFMVATFQFAVLFFAYLSVLNSARDVGRWLVVHPNTTDAVATANIKARLPSDLDASKLTITFSPACGALVSGKCANRPVGSTLTATLNYDAGGSMFLPSTFRLGSSEIAFPTSLPTYKLYLSVEPS